MSLGDSQLSKSAVSENSYLHVSALVQDKTLSQSGASSSSQTTILQPLDLLQSLSKNSLLSAPLISLSQPEGSLSSQPSTTQPLDPFQSSSQNSLLSAPLSSLSQPGGSLSSQSSTVQTVDLLQASSQNSLLSVPLSSLSQPGGSLSLQPSTTQPLDPFRSSSQNSLLSAPLSNLSQLGGTVSSQASTMCSLDLSRASSQNSLLSAPVSSLSQPGGTVSSQASSIRAMDLSGALPQRSLLSVPLSSLSGQQGTSLKTDSQNSPILLPLSSLSQPSHQQESFAASSHAGSAFLSVPLSSLSLADLQTQSASLLSTSLNTLSQTLLTSQSGSQQANKQDTLVSIPLSSLSPPSPALSSTRYQNLETVDSQYNLDAETFESDTSNVKCLAEKLDHVKIVNNASRIDKVKKDYNQNHEAKYKDNASATPSSTVDQRDIRSEQKIVNKQVGQKRQIISPLTAKPTLFALTLCYSAPAKKSSSKTVVQRVIQELQSLDCLHLAAFDFSTPSPDDIVKKKQKGAFSRKK